MFFTHHSASYRTAWIYSDLDFIWYEGQWIGWAYTLNIPAVGHLTSLLLRMSEVYQTPQHHLVIRTKVGTAGSPGATQIWRVCVLIMCINCCVLSTRTVRSIATQLRTRPDMGSPWFRRKIASRKSELIRPFKGKGINTPEHMLRGQGKTNPSVNATEPKWMHW